MSNIWLNLYSESNGNKFYWRADARVEQTWLFGIMIKKMEDGSTIVTLPTVEMLDSAKIILDDQKIASEIAWAICFNFSRWQKDEDIFTVGYGNKPSDMKTITQGKYIKFHRDNTCKFEKTDYYANVRLDSLWINGFKIEWSAKDKKINIIMPSVQTIEDEKRLISDANKREEIISRVQEMYQRNQSSSLQKNVEENKNMMCEDSAPPIPQTSANQTLENQENDGNEEERNEKKPKNAFGRVYNADDSLLLKYIAGNVLRPVEMIDKLQAGELYYPTKLDEGKCIYAINSGIIKPLDIEILSQLARFRYLTSAMTIDLYSAGCIVEDKSIPHFTQTRLLKRINILMKYNLITVCRFISVDENEGDYDFTQQSVGRIYTLNANGATLLQELGREASAKAFDSYQDAAVVRERLCINQWIVYWLNAYPEVVDNHFDFNTIIYRYDLEMSGVRLPSRIVVKDQMLIGQYVRRCAAEDVQESHDDMLNKLARYGEVFSDTNKLFSYKNNVYAPIKLQKRPIINYICEDEQHMNEVAEIIKPNLPKGLEVWLTYDQRIFNYEFEGRRFWRMDNTHEPKWIGADEVFYIGQERKAEKAFSSTEMENDEVVQND